MHNAHRQSRRAENGTNAAGFFVVLERFSGSRYLLLLYMHTYMPLASAFLSEKSRSCPFTPSTPAALGFDVAELMLLRVDFSLLLLLLLSLACSTQGLVLAFGSASLTRSVAGVCSLVCSSSLSRPLLLPQK